MRNKVQDLVPERRACNTLARREVEGERDGMFIHYSHWLALKSKYDGYSLLYWLVPRQYVTGHQIKF